MREKSDDLRRKEVKIDQMLRANNVYHNDFNTHNLFIDSISMVRPILSQSIRK